VTDAIHPEVDIHGIASGGEGVGTLPDGRVVFVHRTAPGDRVRVRLETEKKRWARGRLEKVLREAPERRCAPCPHYERCGGCTLEHLEYPAQLRWKGRIVADALERIGGLELPPPEVRAAPLEFRYRRRVTFTLKRLGSGRVVAGFHELDRPGRIVDLGGDCLLPVEDVAEAWDALRSGWGADAHRLPAGQTLRLTLRAVSGGTVLVVRGGHGEGKPRELLEAVPGLRAVWKETRDRRARLLAGEGATVESWAGEELQVRGSAFLQVNREAAEALQKATVETLGPVEGLRVVDAYCGLAPVGRLLARRGARVTGIEVDEDAVAGARDGAPPGLTLLEGPVEERLPEALPADRAILNPPRTGLEERVPEILLEAGPSVVVYVSCDPATLARDTERLGPGYRFREVRAFDLFPQTAHVESVVTFDRIDREG